MKPAPDHVAPEVADPASAEVGERGPSDEEQPLQPRDRGGRGIVGRFPARDRWVHAKQHSASRKPDAPVDAPLRSAAPGNRAAAREEASPARATRLLWNRGRASTAARP